MPRFNFKSFVRKNSLTEFSSINDLQPQTEWEEKHASKRSPVSATETLLESTRIPEIGSQLPSFNESSYIDSSYDDSSVFERDDSLTENGTLSGDTRHQFSVQKGSNANSVTLPAANSTNETIRKGNII
jgi:hypothetical protein